jgi:hypothetical protein
LRRLQYRRTVVDRRRGYPHRLAQFHQVCHSHRVEKRLRLGEEIVAFRSAQHDGDLLLTELGKADHRTHVEPMLTG